MSHPPVSVRVADLPTSAIHEIWRLSGQVDDVAFLSWAKPAVETPDHIKEGAERAIVDGRSSANWW